ncbi:MAG: type II secretion system protein [Planctomycetes bacterium]|nr:type II secretion system protein [Planctomycetota bacterium]
MKKRYKQSGRTLVEMTVVITAIVLLGSFGLPAIRAFLDSFESGTGARPVISAAMASARAIAAKEQRYAGIRFQKAYHPDGPLAAPQYMVFIVQDPSIGAYFFRAVEGLQPIKLPDSLGVMDLKHRTNLNPRYSGDDPIDTDVEISDLNILRDTTAFSIIFSPSGKLVIHNVRVRNRDGEGDSPSFPDLSRDDIFNKSAKVNAGIAMFYQDDYANLGLGQEESRRGFIIYDRLKFKRAYQQGQAYSGYLWKLIPDAIYINPYTGTMIEK